MALEEEFIITIPDAESEKILSVEDAINFVAVRGARARAACAARATRAHPLSPVPPSDPRSQAHPNAK